MAGAVSRERGLHDVRAVTGALGQGLAGHGENSGIYSLWDGTTGGYGAGEECDLT